MGSNWAKFHKSTQAKFQIFSWLGCIKELKPGMKLGKTHITSFASSNFTLPTCLNFLYECIQIRSQLGKISQVQKLSSQISLDWGCIWDLNLGIHLEISRFFKVGSLKFQFTKLSQFWVGVVQISRWMWGQIGPNFTSPHKLSSRFSLDWGALRS